MIKQTKSIESPEIHRLKEENCLLTLSDAGGWSKCPYGFSIGCHFSQDHAMVTKILDFINKHPKLKVVKSFSGFSEI